MSPNNDRRITVAVLVSLLIHLVAGSMLSFPSQPSALLPRELEVFLKGKEVADISQPLQEERPTKARFVGLYDSKVEEEQVGVGERIPPSRRRLVTGPEGRALSNQGEGMERTGRTLEGRTLEGPEERGESLASIMPEDFFPDIKIGDKTYLNMQRYPKIQYFVELKQRISLTWDPVAAVRRSNTLFGISRMSIAAILFVEIDREGELRSLYVYKSSGFPWYDEEALRAIRDSAPFSAPPLPVLEMDGHEDDVLTLQIPFTLYFS